MSVQRAVALQPVDPDAVGHVVENRFGERVRALEDHAHAAAQAGDVHFQNVLAVQRHRPFGARVPDRFVDAVQGAQEGGFAAARRPDQAVIRFSGDLDVDIVQRLEAP